MEFDLAKMINENRKGNNEDEIDFSKLSIDVHSIKRDLEKRDRFDNMIRNMVNNIIQQ